MCFAGVRDFHYIFTFPCALKCYLKGNQANLEAAKVQVSSNFSCLYVNRQGVPTVYTKHA